MATQRPKRNNSPITSKHQPLKATVPLSSLIRNTSPTRRRTSPSSPGLPSDKRNKHRRSPDVSNPSEHRNLFSPLGSKVNLFKPVSKDKAGKNIRRTNSLETLSSSYINGQWPRENTPVILACGSGICNKSTQTQWDSDPEESSYPNLDHRKPQAISNTGSKEIFRQCLQRTKQQSSSQPSHGKQSPVQGDHSTFSQYYPTAYSQSKPVPIPQPQVPSSPKNPSLHTRRSVEGLNIELEGLDLDAKEDQVFARTPPDGHRPPVPGIKTTNSTVRNVDTQTSNSWMEVGSLSPSSAKDKHNNSISPAWVVSPPPENKSPIKNVITANLSSSIDSGIPERETPPEETTTPNQVSKYASSPKPNNSFWFSRGPPDGAEKVPLSVEEIESDAKVECNSCPDTSKMTIQFSKDSAFCSLTDNQQRCTKKVS